MLRNRCSLPLLAVACLTAGPSVGYAVGLYNMPTSLRQCFGVGFGPGYHANMVLGPCWKAGAEGKHVTYVRNAFAPPPATSFAAPTAWNPGCNAGGCGQGGYAPQATRGMNYGGPAFSSGQPTPAASVIMGPSDYGSPEMIPTPAAMP